MKSFSLLKKATNGINADQSPIKASADKQQRQVIAPPKPPNNPAIPRPPAAKRSGGGNGALKTANFGFQLSP